MGKWKRALFCGSCFGYVSDGESKIPRVCTVCGADTHVHGGITLSLIYGARRRITRLFNPFRRYEDRVPGKPETHTYTITIRSSPVADCCTSSGEWKTLVPSPAATSKKPAKKKRPTKKKQGKGA